MRTPQGSVVRVRVRQGSGFHTMAELNILSLRGGVANIFVIAGRFITDNRELARNFPFYRAPSATVAGLNDHIYHGPAVLGEPPDRHGPFCSSGQLRHLMTASAIDNHS